MKTEKQKLANWTELVHPGENVEIEKGVISASGSGGSGGGGVKIVNEIVTDDDPRLDTTFAEIKAAFLNGMQVILFQRPTEGVSLYTALTSLLEEESTTYSLTFDSVLYTTTSPDGYPVLDID